MSLNSFVGFFDPTKKSKASLVFKATTPKQQYGPTPDEMEELCVLCEQDYTYRKHIMDAIWSTLEVANGTYREGVYLSYKDGGINPKKALDWKTVYKTLLIIEYMAFNASQSILSDIRAKNHLALVSAMKSYKFREIDGTDHGANVRKRAETVLNEITDENIEETRAATRARKSIYSAVASNNVTGVGAGFQPGMRVDYKAGRCKVVESNVNYSNSYGSMGGPLSSKDIKRSTTQDNTDKEYEEYLKRKHAGAAAAAISAAASGPKSKEPEVEDELPTTNDGTFSLAKMEAQFSGNFETQPVNTPIASAPVVPVSTVTPVVQTVHVSAPVVAAKPPVKDNFFDMFGGAPMAPIVSPAFVQEPIATQKVTPVTTATSAAPSNPTPSVDDFFGDFSSFNQATAPAPKPVTKKQDLDALLEF